MIVHRPRVSIAVGMVVALVVVGLHARACHAPGEVAAPPAAACVAAPEPVAAAAVAVAEPAAPEPASSAAASGPAPAIPSVTSPCVDDTTELLAGDGRPLLCWGTHCLTDPGNLTSAVSRPAVTGDSDEIVVEGGRVCTGPRCDRVGRRLGAAIAAAAEPTLDATRDHAAVVVATAEPDGAPRFEIWNRAADRKIDLGSPEEDEGGISKVTTLGDLLIVTRECLSKRCTPRSRIVDARGRYRGDVPAADGESEEAATTTTMIVALEPERRVARGMFDELVLLDHGRITATASLSDIQTVRLDDHMFAVLRCSGSAPDGECHLMWRRMEDDGSAGAEITAGEDDRLPRCPENPAR